MVHKPCGTQVQVLWHPDHPNDPNRVSYQCPTCDVQVKVNRCAQAVYEQLPAGLQRDLLLAKGQARPAGDAEDPASASSGIATEPVSANAAGTVVNVNVRQGLSNVLKAVSQLGAQPKFEVE